MKILVNRKIKNLFCKILISVLAFVLYALLLIFLGAEHTPLLLLAGTVLLSMVILIFCYHYFQDQQKMMEDAVAQIQEYLSGNRDARIFCDEEGEFYRLFHEVNTLAAVLNAAAQREKNSRQFLKNTISDISHQLKTPLAALNIYNGLLQGETKGDSQLHEVAALSEKELERIETLIQNLLKIAKLDAGSIVFEQAWENVADMMGEVELHFAYRAEQEGKELVFEGNDEIKLFCDRIWMMEAVENLVKNALDHTEKGDFIQIHWRTSASMVQILIKDNGKGIHPEDLHYIFKRFYRSRFSQDQQGIGLGLPLAKMIVEAHGGTIEVDSESGAGAAFTITCPQFQKMYEDVKVGS